MLYGNYKYTVDAKSRVFLPAKWKPEMTPNVQRIVVTRDVFSARPAPRLQCFSEEAWAQEIVKHRTGIEQSSETFTNKLRIMLAHAYPCDVDKQGRFVIPATLREFAKIDDEAMIIGVIDRMEIWNPKIWDVYENEASYCDEAPAGADTKNE